MDERLRAEILDMAAADERVRKELAADGSLFAVGYQHPRMEAVHRRHAIGDPPLQRSALGWFEDAAGRGEAPAWQAAMLEDRIRVFEGRSQLFGTQFDADDAGLPVPLPIEEPEGVDERRRRVGLEPLEEAIRRLRGAPPEPVRGDRAGRRREFEAWARDAGWRR